MANAITTTSSATLELQAERTWKYLTGGDYTAVFQYLEDIPWVRIYTLTLQAIMAFITFFYVMGYVVGRALRLAYDAIRAALPVVVSWLNQQQQRAMALRQQLTGTPSDSALPDGPHYDHELMEHFWAALDETDCDEEAMDGFLSIPNFSVSSRSFGTALDQEPEFPNAPTTESIQ